ncbi:MAG: helix-turn-helix domain-containing protein [Haloarcula sp.]
MISLTIDIAQDDCPYVRTSDEYAVSMTGLYSDFLESKQKLKTRMFVGGSSDVPVERALEAFRQAFEAGYFETPRGIELEELGAAAGVSGTGFSKNLRRATDTLAEHVVEAADAMEDTE